MKILVISDLHIGLSDVKNNDFHFTDREFSQYLKIRINKYDLVILNGDILELWQSNFDTSLELFYKIVEDRPLTFELFKKHLGQKLIYINGNHDPVVRTEKLLPCLESYDLVVEGVKLHFEHGHKADFFNYTFKNFGRIFTQVGSLTETYLNKDIDVKFEELLAVVDGHSDPKKEGQLEKYAVQLGELKGYHAVIMSHTHHQCTRVKTLKNGRKMIYANTGSGVYKRSIDELIVTVNNGKITVTPQKFTLE